MNAIQNIYGEKSFSPPRRSISGNIDQTELARIQLEKANLQKTVLVLDQTVDNKQKKFVTPQGQST